MKRTTAKVALLTIALSATSTWIVALNSGGRQSIALAEKAEETVHRLDVDFDGYDYMTNTIVMTTALGNTVHFSGQNYGCYNGQMTLYNKMGNVDAISGMSSISVGCVSGTVKIEAGFEEGEYLLEASFSESGTHQWDFDGYSPAYFRISSNFATISSIEITYSCQRSETPQEILDELNSLVYELNSDGDSYSVYPLHSSIKEANIPETYEGLPVTNLKYDCWNSLPNLAKVNVPSHVRILNTNAFASCPKLASVTLEEGLRQIEGKAFNGCSSLTRIDLPSTVTNISSGTNNPFAGCANLSYIGVNEGSEDFKSRDGVLYEKKYGAAVHTFPRALSLDSYSVALDTSRVRSCAFKDCNIRNVTLPDSLTVIEDDAFRDCTIETIAFGNGLKTIGTKSFDSCSRLTSITIPSSLESIGDSAFAFCRALSSIDIPDSVTYIGPNAFFSCSGLLSATIGDGIESINSQFTNCSALATLTLGAKLKSISLSGCSSLSSIIVSSENTSFRVQNGVLFSANISKLFIYPAAKADAAYTVPSAVASIGSGAFNAATNLKQITLPEGLETIGYESFKGSGIASLVLPSTVTTLESRAFSSCSYLSAADLSSTGITTLPIGLFDSCSSLTSLILPSSISSIENQAFLLTGLQEIQFQGSMEQWGSVSLASGWNQWAFNLKYIVCSDGTITL